MAFFYFRQREPCPTAPSYASSRLLAHATLAYQARASHSLAYYASDASVYYYCPILSPRWGSAPHPRQRGALDPHLWTDAGEGLCRYPIPHAIRPSVVDWNNTEALLSRLNLRRLNQPALTGESLCYGSGNSPTDELHGGLNKWPSYSLWPPISPALFMAVAPGRRLLACTKLPNP